MVVPAEVMEALGRGVGEEGLRARFPEYGDQVGEWARQYAVIGRGIRAAGVRMAGLEVKGYRLISEIARGGQGTVYRAVREGGEGTGEGVTVGSYGYRGEEGVDAGAGSGGAGGGGFAVKVLREAGDAEEGAEHYARLVREAEVLRTVEHPRIVRPHEVGMTPSGRAYLVMDYVEGSALTPEAVKGLELSHRVALLGAVARTVGAAHAKGVVHRDLKPSNILVAKDGAPVVLDFGMASVMNAEELRQTLTTTGQFVGTYLWASPEQLRGERDLTAASDVYALGVLLHQLATGRFPPQVFSSLRRLIEPGEETGEGLGETSVVMGDARLGGIIRKCLSVEAGERYADGTALAEEIEAYLTGQVEEGEGEKGTGIRRKRALWAVGAGLGVLGVVLAGVWWGVEWKELEPWNTGVSETGKKMEQLKLIPLERLVYIPPGEVLIGTPEGVAGRTMDERRQMFRLERGFYMARNEVSQVLYKMVMGVNPSRFTEEDRLPVERVSWYDAMEFCRRLSEMEGRTYRLPTDLEWEYACRAGSTTIWNWGDSAELMSRYANFADKSSIVYDSIMVRESYEDGWPGTSPVGFFYTNGWGLSDMHGNVWEWTSSEYFQDPIARLPAMEVNTGGEVVGSTMPAVPFRVSRGGSWHDTRLALKSAGRNPLRPDVKTSTLGFRIAMDESEAGK